MRSLRLSCIDGHVMWEGGHVTCRVHMCCNMKNIHGHPNAFGPILSIDASLSFLPVGLLIPRIDHIDVQLWACEAALWFTAWSCSKPPQVLLFVNVSCRVDERKRCSCRVNTSRTLTSKAGGYLSSSWWIRTSWTLRSLTRNIIPSIQDSWLDF